MVSSELDLEPWLGNCVAFVENVIYVFDQCQ